MKRLSSKFWPVLLLAAVASCAAPERSEPADQSQPAERPARTRESAQASRVDKQQQAYIETIDRLIPGMGYENLVEREKPQREFELMCNDAGTPGNEESRIALCNAVMARLGPSTPKPARVWMLRRIEQLGRDEVVDGLRALLGDDDAQIRELARRALCNNTATRAADVLRNALTKSSSAEWTVALINALAARQDQASFDVIEPLTRSSQDDVALAAIAALPQVGGARARETLSTRRSSEDAAVSAKATDALLRLADRLCDENQLELASDICHELYQSARGQSIRLAALHGIAKADGADALPILLDVIRSDTDASMRLSAVRIAQQLPGERVTERLANALDESDPDAQVLLLDALGGRSDAAARNAVIGMLASPVEDVRVAALTALGNIGDESAVTLLATIASRSEEGEQNAARASLARLRGSGVDETLLQGMDTESSSLRVELIKALQARRVTRATELLIRASSDPYERVRVAALEALAALAREEDLPRLVVVVAVAQGEETRAAAEGALLETARRIGDRDERVSPIVRALPGAQPPLRTSLIRVLGKLEGESALTAVRATVDDPDENVRDAAVRALAGWSKPAVIDDLLAIAENSGNDTHRSLALRGCARLARLPSDRGPGETLDILRKVMALAGNDAGVQTLTLAAIGEIPSSDALNYASEFLETRGIQAEAGAAVLQIARPHSAEDYAGAIAAVARVRAIGATPARLIDETEAFIQAHRGYCTNWVVSGPFTESGKKGTDLINVAFPPEDASARDVVWRRLEITDPANPWAFDLTGLGVAQNCCAYVKTLVWSERMQNAGLQIGSDDGVKVWLNREVVHHNNVTRPLECGSDTCAIELAQGWNELLIKITQGSGGWGICCGVRGPDGNPIDGIAFTN